MSGQLEMVCLVPIYLYVHIRHGMAWYVRMVLKLGWAGLGGFGNEGRLGSNLVWLIRLLTGDKARVKKLTPPLPQRLSSHGMDRSGLADKWTKTPMENKAVRLRGVLLRHGISSERVVAVLLLPYGKGQQVGESKAWQPMPGASSHHPLRPNLHAGHHQACVQTSSETWEHGERRLRDTACIPRPMAQAPGKVAMTPVHTHAAASEKGGSNF
ncbi:hypothetical protein B0T17DRAFT_506571 [Bombardia bombarda]|uniref:Uncharacterized protein n=1 Tax=Bombardia bombarda TaxID=252184 RepID=A0AA39XAF9_9PEZI|nr:hypothetical protein B0T17DRAFT_506571 [Bombardia bombarda]